MVANDNVALGVAVAAIDAWKVGKSKAGFDNINAVQTLIRGGEALATADHKVKRCLLRHRVCVGADARRGPRVVGGP